MLLTLLQKKKKQNLASKKQRLLKIVDLLLVLYGNNKRQLWKHLVSEECFKSFLDEEKNKVIHFNVKETLKDLTNIKNEVLATQILEGGKQKI